MQLELDGRTAVVTGASKGIGLAIVEALALEGAKVLAVARGNSPELATLVDEHPVRFVSADLADADGADRLAATAREHFGSVDLLVNNVGASEPAASALDFDDEQWRRIMDVTLLSAVRVTRAVVPLMSDDGGAVVNIASLNATLPAGMIAPYSAAKAALVNFNKALAEDLAGRGIRVNAVSPGPVRTPMWTAPDAFADMMAEQAGVTRDEVMDRLVPDSMGITLGRVGEPDEIADLAVFLCSPRARYITGANYVIDGGMLKSA